MVTDKPKISIRCDIKRRERSTVCPWKVIWMYIVSASADRVLQSVNESHAGSGGDSSENRQTALKN